MASIESLDEAQQFQIIFYNELPLAMTLKSERKADMYRGTEINRTLARQFIIGLEVAGGTDHMPALRAALKLEPDVVFFLTDAGPPLLRAGDLDEVQRANHGKAKIHAIEFGLGQELKLDGSLKSLARQNGGTYRYRDVASFKDRPR
jgi:Ca-activated chloride channel family protein